MNLYYMTKISFFQLKNIICVSICSMLFVFNIVSAQNQPGPNNQYNQAENNYPQTPQASAFEKFVSIPPGNYTGVHGYSVPIYNIQVNEYNFPISIDYHGGGIKLDEISSEVGLGWNLNIGGINLSQEVRGMNDIFSIKVNIENPDNFVNNIWPLNEFEQDAYRMLNGYEYNWFPHPSGNLDKGYEYNPDYYTYSLLNNQGKFIFDKIGVPHTIPKESVQILNEGTTLIDQKGIIYKFIRYQHTENKMPASNGTIPQNQSHAYRIDNIVFPNGEIIKFNYIQENYTYISNFSTSKRIYVSGHNLSCIFPVEDDKPTTVRTYAQIHLIESIEFKSTVIKFKYLNNANTIIDREDIKGGASLEGIDVYFKGENEHLQLRKNYKINTSYFISPNGHTDVPVSNDFPRENLFKRLRLDSIHELLSNQTYSFEYENEYQLPARFSYGTDHWGVFNGAPNETPLPYYVYTDLYSGREKLLTGGDKYPKLDYAKTGVLKKVHLPTGGSQEFEYELDEYRIHEDPEFCMSDNGQLCPDEEEIRFYHEEYYLNDDYSEQLEFFESQLVNGLVAEMPLNPNYEKDFRDGFDYKLEFHTNYPALCDIDGLPKEDEGYFIVELYESGNPTPIDRMPCNMGEHLLPKLNQEKNYSVKIFYNYGHWYHNDFVTIQLKLDWVQNDRRLVKNKQTGTLRTKSITLNDSNGNPQIKRRFEYNYFKYPQYSGGILRSRPINTIFQTHEPGADPYPGANDCYIYNGTCTYITLSSSPAYNLNNSFGKSVYYENVTEIYEDLQKPTQSYKKELEFTTLPEDYNDQNSRFPLTYWTHVEYLAGKSERERWYNNSGEKIKNIENFYDYDSHFNFNSADHQGSILSFGVHLALTGLELIHSEPCFYKLYPSGSYYQITSAWVKHLKTVTEDWKDGVKIMSDSIQYQYSPTYAHLNPVSVTRTNSFGQELKTEFEYNHPYKTDEPTTVRQYENGSPISVQQTKFYPSGLPQYVFTKKAASTLDSDPPSEDLMLIYDHYDANGNLTQYTMANGTPVSIIWGYNGQYPIAKVEGVAYSTIETMANTLSGLSNSGSLNENSFENLRNVAGALVTCYIYKPLVGVTTIIQPNGQKETYEYDTSGRLEYVKDHNGNVIKKMDYHYKNQ